MSHQFAGLDALKVGPVTSAYFSKATTYFDVKSSHLQPLQQQYILHMVTDFGASVEKHAVPNLNFTYDLYASMTHAGIRQWERIWEGVVQDLCSRCHPDICLACQEPLWKNLTQDDGRCIELTPPECDANSADDQ